MLCKCYAPRHSTSLHISGEDYQEVLSQATVQLLNIQFVHTHICMKRNLPVEFNWRPRCTVLVTPIASWTRKWRKCNNVTRSEHAFGKSPHAKTSTRDRREDWFTFAKTSTMMRRSRNMPNKDFDVGSLCQSYAKWEKRRRERGLQDTNWYLHKVLVRLEYLCNSETRQVLLDQN
jgi:hypothetical protein